jgi:hypothetical protein
MIETKNVNVVVIMNVVGIMNVTAIETENKNRLKIVKITINRIVMENQIITNMIVIEKKQITIALMEEEVKIKKKKTITNLPTD